MPETQPIDPGLFTANPVEDTRPLFEEGDLPNTAVARYNAALRTAISSAVAYNSGVPTDTVGDFISNTEKLKYATPAEFQFITNMDARMSAWAEAQRISRQVVASPESSLMGMEHAATLLPSLLDPNATPEQTAYTLQTGNEVVAAAAARKVVYHKDLMEGLESAGWDYEKGLMSNLWDIRTAAELLPFRMVYDWTKYVSPAEMKEYQTLPSPAQDSFRKEVLRRLKQEQAYPLTILHVMDMLDPTREPGEGLVAEAAWGVADIAGSIFQIPATLKLAGKIKKPIILHQVNKLIESQKLSRATGAAAAVGDTDTAARVASKVLTETDGTVGKAANLTKFDAAVEASPFDFRPLTPEQTQGLSAKTIQTIEDERKIQYWYILKAMGKDVSQTSGLLRPEEQLVALERIRAALPESAQVVKTTPFGVQVKVTIRNEGKFKSEEDLLKAQNSYEQAITDYTLATQRLDEFWQDAATGKFQPDPAWVNRLEGQKQAAKIEMDRLEGVLVKGIEPDKINETFVFYNRDDVGSLAGDVSVMPVAPLVLSPDVWMRPIDKLLVTERTTALAKQEQLFKLYREAMFEVLSKVGKRGSEKVDRILLHGDDAEKVFLPHELKMGVDVPGVGTIRLSDKEVSAYLKYRDLLDQAHNLRSVMKYRELGHKGFRQTVINNLGKPQKVFVKTYTVAGKSAIPDVARIWDTTSRDPSKITALDDAAKLKLRTDIDKGKKVVVELESRIKSGDEEFSYMIVNPNKVLDLTPDVLPYKGKFYVPRITKDAPYVVRAKKDILVDGKKATAWNTVRFFDRSDEAKEWAAIQQREKSVEHVADSDWNWKEIDVDYSAASDEAVFTGLFNDHRGELIPFGSAGVPAPRVDAMGSLERYLTNLSWAYPLNQFREAAITRFVNSVGDYLQNPHAWMDTELKFKPGVPVAAQNGVKEMRQWLMDTIGITTEGERKFARSMKQAAEYLEQVTEGGVLDKVRLKALYGADHVNIAGAFRNLNYRMHLAMGNPAQIFVQMGNVSQILLANPQNAHRVIPRILGVRMAAFVSPDSPVFKDVIKYYAGVGMMRASDFEDMMRVAWNSGYFFTVRTNADAALALRGIAPGGDIRHAARFVDTALQLPFLEGELISRIVGLVDAYTRIKKVNKGALLADDVNRVNDVIREALRVGYNYTQVNRAAFQKHGIASIITQFMQPMTKFYEEVMLPTLTLGKVPSRFTRNERLRLLLGQPILFGMAGVAFGNFMKEYVYSMYEAWTGKPRTEITKDEITAIEGGITDLAARTVISALTDKDVSPVLSERIALMNLNQFMAKFAPETGMYDFLLGAGAVLPRRLKLAWNMWHDLHGTAAQAGTFGAEDVYGAFYQLSTLATSMTNAQKARIWNSAGAIMDSEFKTKLYEIDPGDPNGITMLRAWGFSSYEEKAVYEMRGYMEDNATDKDVTAVVEAISRLTLNYLENGDLTNDPKKLAEYQLQKEILVKSLPSAALRNKAREQWSKALISRNFYVTQAAEKYLDMQLQTDELEKEAPASLNIVTE